MLQAGAAIVHLHMRNAQDEACSDVELFRRKPAADPRKVRCDHQYDHHRHQRGQHGGVRGGDDERIAPVIELEPEMCSHDAASF